MRVRGRNGVYSLASPFTVNVTIQRGLCQNLDTTLVPGNLPATSGNYHTIILVDPTRMTGSPAAINAMLAKLAQLAARPEVQGVVVNVSQDARVAAANLQADQKVNCPEAKNLVADATRQIVQHYRDLNPLEYVVIVGNDNAIPFFRTPDQAHAGQRGQLHTARVQRYSVAVEPAARLRADSGSLRLCDRHFLQEPHDPGA